VLEEVRQLAASPETTVLVTGETGTGKEVAARHLHALSRPVGSPFVAIDCLALPGSLAESLLFGHEKGAFTDAGETRAGAFEDARDGTVFLDEIGDMSDLQGKLLRVLEGRSFHRLGSSREQPLRARVVAATNQDLPELVRQGRFRRDLYERISVFPLQIPPLRSYRSNVELLAHVFRQQAAERHGRPVTRIAPEALARLIGYDYPGNVRELRNAIEHAVVLAEGGVIDVEQLPDWLRQAAPTEVSAGTTATGSMRPSSATMTARSTMLRSSRTLPG
jgi:transcriptional regulator with GAF, ATPase, and Fis domain